MKIPLLDLKAQYAVIRQEVEAALNKVIENQDFILGREVSSFEKETAEYCGTKYGVGVASGTDALILALKALNVGPGDEVITTPFTFFATAESISIVGARPVFVDIDPKTYNIDPALVAKKITRYTKAIMPVHLYGQCADMDPIMDVARKHGLKVIEDNAQAIGATYKGRPSGSMGDIGALSFFPSKNLGGFGDGGMCVTNDAKLAEKISCLRVHGSAVRYIHSEIGMNSRLDNLQAAVLRIKLKYLDKWLQARKGIADFYNGKLKNLPITCPYVPGYNVHTYHQYTLRVQGSGFRVQEKIMKYLADNGIETRTYYPIPLHLQDCYKGLGCKKGDIKESERACEEAFSIPVFPELTQDQKDYVIEIISKFFS
ncbi:MAG: DegT/DnrJ/EryC1/StrS family aminotransferase [Candidatus Omnitrophota bacterium]|nr:DegT/DnrJ/EryC1/StrS family aminotransferase [Candidatus Omnitrophota bacterium]